MVHDEVEADIRQMHLFHNVVELRPRQHLQRIAVDVEYPIAFDLGVAALDQALVSVVLSLWILGILSILLCIKSLRFSFPFFLDYLYHCVLLCFPLRGRVPGLASWHGVLWDEAVLLLGEAVVCSSGLRGARCASFRLLIGCSCANNWLRYRGFLI